MVSALRQESTALSVDTRPYLDREWANYFDEKRAYTAFVAHLKGLASHKTPEKHTARKYQYGLTYFLKWSQGQQPSEDLMLIYIAHLKDERGVSSGTIAATYLAPVRIYFKALAKQKPEQRDDLPDRVVRRVASWRVDLHEAANVKNPAQEETLNVGALWNPKFQPLTLRQAKAVMKRIDRNTLVGKRNYALLLLAFNSGFRLAELARVTLAKIQETEGAAYLITVRGKRNNMTPVPVNEDVILAIDAWVQAYNAELADDDPRRITDDCPLWQPLTRTGNRFEVGSMIGGRLAFDPMNGMSHTGIRSLIKKIAGINPHDTRRTTISNMMHKGVPIHIVQRVSRHKNPATTIDYTRGMRDWDHDMVGNFVSFAVD